MSLLDAIALGMMRQISSNIQNATFFTIIADKTAYVFNKEELVILHSVGWRSVLRHPKISLECIR